MSEPSHSAPSDDARQSYWSERLAARPPALELPTSHQRPAQPTRARARLAFKLEPALAGALGLFSRDERVTPFDTLVAGWALLLFRTTRQTDLLVGLHEGQRHAALRLLLEGGISFRELLARTCAEAASARAHALELPLLLRAAHATRADALFQTVVTSERVSVREAQGLDLVFSVTKGPKGALSLALAYDSELFEERTIERLRGHLQTLLSAALERPDAPLGTLPFLTQAERHTLLHEWNATAVEFPREQCLHMLFERAAETCPDAPAVVCAGRRLTYAALDARANRLARHLRGLGVGPGVLVGIAVERTPEMVVGLLAIAKSGGAYVPMDPAYPAERLGFMLADSGVKVLLTQRSVMRVLPEPGHEVQLVLLDSERPFQHDSRPVESGVRAEDLAYVIYTSGSTGKPKGVALDHRGRVNNFLDFNRRFGVATGDALIALASLSFDMCAYDVFGTLAAGATIVLPGSDEQDPGAWARLMQEQRVTLWHTAPAVLQMLVERCEAEPALAPPALRLALLGGDWIPVSLPDRLRALVPTARVVSMGGATECSMDSTLYEIGRVDPAWRSIPYGKPMANQRAYVLDEERQPLPIGVAGELYLGGIGVGHGYLERPELTAERFLDDPFAGVAGARMYRTGDLARWMEDGNLELLGRVDNQVKIRGYRVELGEIEARLRAHPAVAEGVVAARTDGSGEKRLVAYFTAEAQSTRRKHGEERQHRRATLPVGDSASSAASGLAAELRAFLAADLPHYMVPTCYVRLDALPLSPNGKVDRKHLPEPEPGRPEHLPALVAARDELEELLVEIWSEVLGLDAVGIEDPFLDLGGHSILAAQIQARLAERLPFEVALRDLFDTSTVSALAAHLRTLARSSGVDLDEVCRVLRSVAELPDDEVVRRLAAGP